MPVAVIQPNQQRQADPLEKLETALNIAKAGFGIVADMKAINEAKLKRAKEEEKLDLDLKEAKRKDQEADAENATTGPVLDTIRQQSKLRGLTLPEGISVKQARTYFGDYSKPKEAKQYDPLAAEMKQGRLDKMRTDAEETAAAKRVRGYQASPGFAPTKDDAKNLKELSAAKEIMVTTAERLKNLIDSKGTETVFGDTSDEMFSLVNDLKLQIKDVNKLGQLTGGDFALIDSKVLDPTAFGANFRGNNRYTKNLDTLIESANNRVNSTAHALGFQPAGKKSAPPSDIAGVGGAVKDILSGGRPIALDQVDAKIDELIRKKSATARRP